MTRPQRAPDGDFTALTAYAHEHLVRLSPPPVRPHPAAQKLESEVRAWAARAGLCAQGGQRALERRRIGHLVAWCMPHAPFAVARLTAHYLAWVFHFDDTIAEHPAHLNAHLEWDLPGLLRSGRTHPDAPSCVHLTSLAAVRAEITSSTADGGREVLAQLADGLRRYLEGCVNEGPWRASGQPPALDAYLRQRTHTSGGHPLYLHRLAPGMPPSGEPLPTCLTALAELAFLLGGLANDLLGHAAEHRQGDPVNAVTVLAHEYGLAMPDAYRATVVLHAAHKHRFDTDHARLRADPALTPPQRHLAEAIGGWVEGSAAAIEPYFHHLLATRR
ncbi:terpene synthase family protein [Streptomyces sp. NPDC050804]|uniref:terpene synthase family protein n=1 Tax=Streptomyces sp. NPDC050804 TaxID=3154745 RepID=UPI00341963B3